MKKQLLTFVVLLLAGFVCRGAGAAAASPVGLPMASGSYVDWSDATVLKNCKVENGGANVGSTGSATVVAFDVHNSVAQDYILSFATGAKDEATLRLTLAGEGGTVWEADATVADTESWSLTSAHSYLLAGLPEGDYTLTFAVTGTTGKYAGNWGQLAITPAAGFDRVPGSLTLARGEYGGGLRVESAGNVGYIKDGGSAAYTFICTQAGAYALGMEMARYGSGTMQVTLADAATGATEAAASFAIDESVAGSYAARSITLPGSVTAGLKTLTLSFSSPSAGYICNYRDVSLDLLASRLASVSSVTVGGAEAAAGEAADWECTLPADYGAGSVEFTVASHDCTLNVTAVDGAGEPVVVTAVAGATYSVPVPEPNTAVTVTIGLTPDEGAAAVQESYTLRLFRLGDIVMTAMTVDGEELPDVLLGQLNAEGHAAVLSSSVYTSMPAVRARFADGSVVEGEGVLSGSSARYAVDVADGDATRTYVLTIEGVHIYNVAESDEKVRLKYTSEGKSADGTWSDGLYTLTAGSLDGWNNSSFKFNSEVNTLGVPADVVVKQVVFKDFNANYGPGELASLTAGDATVYIPTKHGYDEPDATMYDLIVNIDGHKAGTPVTFTLRGGGQPVAWIELTVGRQAVATPPVPTATDVTPTADCNHCVVTVAFDREMQAAEATVDGRTVTAKGGSSTLRFPVWDLQYDTDYTFTIPAGAARDTYGNANAEPVSVAISVGSRAVAAKAAYDYVVSTAAGFAEAVAAVNAANTSADAPRKTIFIRNGDYDFGSAEQRLTAYNVSLIGESRDGVILHGLRDGISNPVLNLRDRTGFYLQDLTVRNDYDYGAAELKGVAVAVYGGNKTAMRNVRMLSNQDTQVTGERAYFEDCEIHGTVDFICGGGSNYYYNTALVLENRAGNCIAAPSTGAGLDFGYVFDRCTISCAEGAGEAVGGTYSLGRPWQNEPRIAFINTTMEVLPRAEGWAAMANLPTHFFEFGSVDGEGEPVDLSGRKNSPSSTNAYNPVLTAEEADGYNLRSVLGGTDSWLPTEETAMSGAPVVAIEGNTISWTDLDDARCYVVFRDGQYLDNVTATTYELPGEGTYTVRSANRNGGLGGESAPVRYATGVEVSSFGWATACLSYASRVPEGVKAYVISAVDGDRVVLSEVTDIPAGEGFIVTASEGRHEFAPSVSAPAAIDNLLVGTLAATEVAPNSVYVLGRMEDTGNAAMMLYTGTAISPGHAYMPVAGGDDRKAYRIVVDGASGMTFTEADPAAVSPAYGLGGQRVGTMRQGGIYIVDGKKVIKR